jgi:hypothetical protein
MRTECLPALAAVNSRRLRDDALPVLQARRGELKAQHAAHLLAQLPHAILAIEFTMRM